MVAPLSEKMMGHILVQLQKGNFVAHFFFFEITLAAVHHQ